MHDKRLVVEWRHIEKAGNTCVRCTDTGVALDTLIERLAKECQSSGWDIRLEETILGMDEIDQSNLILINGRPLESILPEASSGKSHCDSCCEFTGQPTDCRTVNFGGETYESLPETLIREAVCRVATCC